MLKVIYYQIIDPVNLLTILLTVLMFCFSSVIMFWFIVANQILDMLSDKLNIIILMAKTNEKIANDIANIVNNTVIDIDYVNVMHSERIEHNYKNLQEQIFPVFYVLFGLLFAVFIHIVYNKIALSKYDKIIIVLSFISGLPDFIFLITLGTKWKFLGDTNIYSLMVDHYIQSRIISIQDEINSNDMDIRSTCNDERICILAAENSGSLVVKRRTLETLQDIKNSINSTITVLTTREGELINGINMCSISYIIVLIITFIIISIYLLFKSKTNCRQLVPIIITWFIINFSILGFVLLMREYAYTFNYITKEEITSFIIATLKNI